MANFVDIGLKLMYHLPMQRKTDLILRTCDANLQSLDGFQYPTEGWVEAPDWDPTDKCGGGIHGLFKGVGNGSLLSNENAKWLVLEVYSDEVVEITKDGSGKCKVPRARVAYVGDKQTAVQMVADRYPELPVAFAVRSVGDGGTSTSGDYGTSTSGNYGTSTSGDYGTSTSGNYGTSTSGYTEALQPPVTEALQPPVTEVLQPPVTTVLQPPVKEARLDQGLTEKSESVGTTASVTA